MDNKTLRYILQKMDSRPWMHPQYRVGETVIYRGEYWVPGPPPVQKEVEVVKLKRNRLGRVSYVVKYGEGLEKEVLFEQLLTKPARSRIPQSRDI